MNDQLTTHRTLLLLFIGVVLLLFTLGIVIIGGFERTGQTSLDQVESGLNSVQVSPSSLFTGDLKRLEPHLDHLGFGCVKLETRQKIWGRFDIEHWEKGKQLENCGGSGCPVSGSIEASFSIRPTMAKVDRFRYALTIAIAQVEGSSSSKLLMEIPSFEDSQHRIREVCTRSVKESVQLTEGETMCVWGYMIGGTGFQIEKMPGESIEEQAKRADVAILVKLTWNNQAPHY